MPSFSERHGIAPAEQPIKIHDDAPKEVRTATYSIADQLGVQWWAMWEVIKQRVAVVGYGGNIPIDKLVRDALSQCDWNEVYDLAEEFYRLHDGQARQSYQRLLNGVLRRQGVGWWMNNGAFERRGAKPYEETVHGALDALHDAEFNTSAKEMEKALHDLSVRPNPDITGAVQHAIAALECVMREVCGDPKPTLGQLLKDHPGKIPSPLNTAIEKVWGYSSEMGRHLREGQTPNLEEAILAVQTSAAVVSYLLAKFPGK